MTKKFLIMSTILVLVLGIIAAVGPIVKSEQTASVSLSAVGVNTTRAGLGVSVSNSISDVGEVKWIVSGERTQEEERRSYEESNYFGLQGIFYPDFLSLQGMGIELRVGAGLRGSLSSKLKEGWSSEQYFSETRTEASIYLLGSLRASVCLNLNKGVERFALTEVPESDPFWSLLDPFYITMSLQRGPGWTTDSPSFKYLNQGSVGLEYRF